MNLERGFKRIVLLLSIIAGIGVSIFWGYNKFSDMMAERYSYLDSCKSLENVRWFWSVWDSNGWRKKVVVKHLLDADTITYPLRRKAIFKRDGNEVDFYSFEVFPGLDESVLDMPPDLLDKTAQQAKSQALANANDPLKGYKQHWNKNFFQIITITIVVGLFFGILAFAFVWIVFFLIRWPVLGLIRWLILGFVDNKK